MTTALGNTGRNTTDNSAKTEEAESGANGGVGNFGKFNFGRSPGATESVWEPVDVAGLARANSIGGTDISMDPEPPPVVEEESAPSVQDDAGSGESTAGETMLQVSAILPSLSVRPIRALRRHCRPHGSYQTSIRG